MCAAKNNITDKKKKPFVKQMKARWKTLSNLQKGGVAGGGVLLLLLLFMAGGSGPSYGSIHYGLCKNYVELNVFFPSTLKVLSVESFDRSHRLYVTYTGIFGEHRSDAVNCKFQLNTETGNEYFESITINRKPIPKEKLDAYNKLLAVIAPLPYDLALPPRPGLTLQSLKTD